MSYDFEMVIEELTTVESGLNYTYNVSKMYYEAFRYAGLEGGINSLHKMLGKDMIDPLKIAIKEMKINSKYYRKMNPRNGWGDYEGALNVLEKLLKWSYSHPKATLIIS